jgi:hypothetical protein
VVRILAAAEQLTGILTGRSSGFVTSRSRGMTGARRANSWKRSIPMPSWRTSRTFGTASTRDLALQACRACGCQGPLPGHAGATRGVLPVIVCQCPPPSWGSVTIVTSRGGHALRGPSVQVSGTNLVLRRRNEAGASLVRHIDPLGDLPRNQASWQSQARCQAPRRSWRPLQREVAPRSGRVSLSSSQSFVAWEVFAGLACRTCLRTPASPVKPGCRVLVFSSPRISGTDGSGSSSNGS